MARRPREVSPDEAELFHEILKDAKPLRKRGPAPPRAPVAATPPPGPAIAPRTIRTSPPKPIPPAPPPLDPGKAAGIDKRTHERFRKGEMAIDARLDLHGMTQDMAHGALTRFVERGAAAGHRMLLIVTGKGGREGTGVLKAETPRWLNEAGLRPLILAIHRARPNHGGEGALYVLLKRKR
jgi:DNA-nicking Smr family endonuclease